MLAGVVPLSLQVASHLSLLYGPTSTIRFIALGYLSVCSGHDVWIGFLMLHTTRARHWNTTGTDDGLVCGLDAKHTHILFPWVG